MPGADDASRLLPGKLPADRLEALLGRLHQADPRVLVGAAPGEDAAVIDVGDRLLVATTDPITFATDRIGWYAVHVNANDVAVMGARPRWFFATLLLPGRHTTAGLVDAIFDDIRATCGSLGVTLCGGHTEITAGLGRPVVVGQMLGDAARHAVVTKRGLRPGDAILLTRGIAIEGTALLARERSRDLAGRVDPDVLTRAANLLFAPGISVVQAADVAVGAGGVHAMHDPTEGGLVSGLHEMARAAGTGMRVRADRVPVLPETLAICQALGADPLRLLASGALLVGAAPECADGICQALERAGIPATAIGEARPAEDGAQIGAGATWHAITPADRDEVARILGG